MYHKTFGIIKLTTILQKKSILVAPLNWGLGHATRCIPVIEELLNQNFKVFIASDGRALKLLKLEFPALTFFELPAYDVHYSTKNMIWNIAWQLPKILMAIWKEKKAVQRIIDEEKIDVILSDNRFGCHSPKTKNIFLTHQLKIKMPYPFLERTVDFFNHLFIKKFNECWIPDFDNEPNLSGELAHGSFLKHSKFIGALSRMEYFETKKKNDVVVVLSGPEPQRTFLEALIFEQIKGLDLKILIVQGKTEKMERTHLSKNIKIVSFLTSKELNQSILSSDLVICRSGYSSIMDLAKLRKRAVLIPTPGQTEQEYLAEKFFREGVFYFQEQRDFDLEEAMKASKKFKGFQSKGQSKMVLKENIQRLLKD